MTFEKLAAVLAFGIVMTIFGFTIGKMVERYSREDEDARLRAEINRLGRMIADELRPAPSKE
jgi:hypothetical protein